MNFGDDPRKWIHRVPADAAPVCEHRMRISRSAGEKALENDMVVNPCHDCHSCDLSISGDMVTLLQRARTRRVICLLPGVSLRLNLKRIMSSSSSLDNGLLQSRSLSMHYRSTCPNLYAVGRYYRQGRYIPALSHPNLPQWPK
jgi:hypothetical protein